MLLGSNALAQENSAESADQAGIEDDETYGSIEAAVDMQRIYIGESTNVARRIDSHYVKTWWTEVIVFTKTDRALGPTEIKGLEHQLIKLARLNGSYAIDNVQTPAEPSVTEEQAADVSSFLSNMLLIFPLLGVTAFQVAPARSDTADSTVVPSDLRTPLSDLESPPLSSLPFTNPRGSHLPPKQMLYLTLGGTDAKGYVAPDGSFVLLAGSKGLRAERGFVRDSTRFRRDNLRKAKVLVEDPEDSQRLVLQRDLVFSSPSAAGQVMYGGNVGGRQRWLNEEGVSLADLEAKAIARNDSQVASEDEGE